MSEMRQMAFWEAYKGESQPIYHPKYIQDSHGLGGILC